AAQIFFFHARRAEEDLVVLLENQLDARLHPRSAADQERAPRMRDLERHAGQRSLRLVAELLEAADPVFALMLALVVLAARIDGVALDRLPFERVPCSGPVLEGAGLEVEIERL